MSVLHKALDERRYHQALMVLHYPSTDVNHQDRCGLTALMKCCHLAELRAAYVVAKEILQCGGDAGIRDLQGRVALHHAALTGRTRLARLLLVNGDFDVNAKNHKGDTALHMAADSGEGDIVSSVVRYLRQYQVTVDIADTEGLTPLMRACKAGHVDIARALVREGGASLTMTDITHHRTAREWLDISVVVPSDSDPFHSNVSLQPRSSDDSAQKVVRIKSAVSRRTKENINDRNVRMRRATSAPPGRRTTPDNSKLECHHSNAWVESKPAASRVDSCGEHLVTREDRECYTGQLVKLYNVYSLQITPAYRPPARKPSPPPPEPPPSPKPPKSPKLAARAKLQKFLKMKRAESIVKAFTGQRRQQRSASVLVPNGEQKTHFQHAVFATLRRRRSTKTDTLSSDATLLAQRLHSELPGHKKPPGRARALKRLDSSESMESTTSSVRSEHSNNSQEAHAFTESVRKVVRMRKLGTVAFENPVVSIALPE